MHGRAPDERKTQCTDGCVLMSCRPRVFGACPPRNPGFENFGPRKTQNFLPRLGDAIGSPLGNCAGCEPAKGCHLGGPAVGVD